MTIKLYTEDIFIISFMESFFSVPVLSTVFYLKLNLKLKIGPKLCTFKNLEKS